MENQRRSTEAELMQADRRLGQAALKQFALQPAWLQELVLQPTYDQRLAMAREADELAAQAELQELAARIHGADEPEPLHVFEGPQLKDAA